MFGKDQTQRSYLESARGPETYDRQNSLVVTHSLVQVARFSANAQCQCMQYRVTDGPRFVKARRLDD